MAGDEAGQATGDGSRRKAKRRTPIDVQKDDDALDIGDMRKSIRRLFDGLERIERGLEDLDYRLSMAAEHGAGVRLVNGMKPKPPRFPGDHHSHLDASGRRGFQRHPNQSKNDQNRETRRGMLASIYAAQERNPSKTRSFRQPCQIFRFCPAGIKPHLIAFPEASGGPG